jgi:hypothetical protein
MFFGTTFSFMLHGITCCQMIWFFRTQTSNSRSSKSLNALVVFVWLAELLNCTFILCATMNAFLLPATTYVSPCTHWSMPSQVVSSAMCTFTVEGFFIMRLWKLSEHKKLTMLAFIPYLAGFAFGVAQISLSFRVRCNHNIPYLNPVYIFGTFSFRILGDGVVAVAMCYILYKKSSGLTRRANTIKIVHGLILYSISTGLLTWLASIFFLLPYVNVVPPGYAFFYMRGGLYVNAMLAQLNARSRFRAMAEETIPLSSISLSEISSSQPVDGELRN